MAVPFPDFTPDTTILSSQVDANNDDIADEITNSLPRDGQAGMTAQLPISDGTAGTPGLAFTLDGNTGIYRIGTDNIGVSAAGSKVLDIDSTGLGVTGGLSITQDVAFTGTITPTQITANTDDYAPTGHATAYTFRLSTDASREITGLQGGATGRKILIHNVGSFDIVLKDESTDSTAANRFQLSADLTLKANTGVELQYDDTSDRWRLTSPQIDESTIGAGKHTIWIPAGSMRPRVSNGAVFSTLTVGSNEFRVLDFDASSEEFVYFDLIGPKSWNEGTVSFQVDWTHGSTTTNFGVTWALEAVAITDGDNLNFNFGTSEQTVDDTGGTTGDHYLSPESSALTISGSPAEGDYILFLLKREVGNASDTLAIDAHLLGVRLFYTTNANTDD